jgi:hypothetical protein
VLPLQKVGRHDWLASTGSQPLTRVASIVSGLKDLLIVLAGGGQKSPFITIYIKADFWPPLRMKLVHKGEMLGSSCICSPPYTKVTLVAYIDF